MAVPPFHEGEREAQGRAGAVLMQAAIRDAMPDQHRQFFAGLTYLAIAGRTADEGLAAGILCGPAGFVSSPDPTRLLIRTLPDAADPLADALRPGAAVGVLGIDFATRRRNRANGRILSSGAEGMIIAVEQSFGNCPKYIQTREIVATGPEPSGSWVGLDGLNDRARSLIRSADSFLVASSSGSEPLSHGGVDISHRGGRPGFVAVNGETLTIPDFAGNRYFNTLGNFLRHPRAALLFIDFETGDLLHLEGRVSVDWFPDPACEGAQRSWTVVPDAIRRRPCGLPLRWAFGDWSPATLATGCYPDPAAG